MVYHKNVGIATTYQVIRVTHDARIVLFVSGIRGRMESGPYTKGWSALLDNLLPAYPQHLTLPDGI